MFCRRKSQLRATSVSEHFSSAAALTIALAIVGYSSTATWAVTPEELLKTMTFEEKVGQLFIGHFNGDEAANPSDDQAVVNRQIYGVDTAVDAVKRFHLGGVIYFSNRKNISSAQQVARLSNDLQRARLSNGTPVPLTIAVDQEGGYVSRLPFVTQFPGAMAVAAAGGEAYAFQSAKITAAELKALGINQNLAPSLTSIVIPRTQ